MTYKSVHSIDYYDEEKKKWKQRTKYKNVTAQVTKRRGLLEVEFELLDAVSGRVLTQTTKEANYHWVKLYDERAPKKREKTCQTASPSKAYWSKTY